MRTCYIHAGGHKTGSSALQLFLLRNRSRLAAAGVLVPSAGMSEKSGPHHDLVNRIVGLPVRPERLTCVEHLKAEVASSDAATMVISSELIETVVGRSPKHTATLVDTFRELGFQVRLVYYLRHQPQLMNSRYSQVVKSFRQNQSFADFIERHLARRASSRVAAGVNRLGIEGIFRPYNLQVRRRGIAADFLEQIGVADPQTFDEGPRVNEAVGPVAIEAARRLMNAMPKGIGAVGHNQVSRCWWAFRDALTHLGTKEPAYSGLTTPLARRIEAVHREHNDEFAERVWGISWADAFAGDVGVEHASNDLAVVAPKPEQQEMLGALLSHLTPRFSAILSDDGFAGKPLHAARREKRRVMRAGRRA